MKINTKLFGVIYRKSNGRWTTQSYLGDLYDKISSARQLRREALYNVRRGKNNTKIVKLTLETVE